jgi:hypothetical protein
MKAWLLGGVLALGVLAFPTTVMGQGSPGTGPYGPAPTCTNQIIGNPGNNDLEGTAGSDFIWGRRGDDRLRGRAGIDCLDGGLGADRVLAGPGDDERIRGGGGSDRIRSHDGAAELVNCGRGRQDVAVVDASDQTENCETVRRR